MNEFLKIEYEQCLDLVKYYDERHQSLVKFCAAMSSAVPSLLLAIFQLGNNVAVHFWIFTSIISLATALGLLAIFTVLVQTRLYFIYPTRQVNAIRRVALQTQNVFNDNQMYLDTTFNAFKWTSSHTLLNGFVVLQIGMFIGLFIYSTFIGTEAQKYLLWLAACVGLLSSILIFGFSAWYLYSKSKQHPDASVHGKRSE